MPLIETKGAASAQGFGLTLGGAQPVYIEDVFSTYLYTGNGSTQTITNGIDLAGNGGMAWIKDRVATWSNTLVYKETSGATPSGSVFSDLTIAQQSGTSYVSSFNANGFSLVSSVNNVSNDTYASWTFRKQPKFFDVVTYTGNGANRTISHNLGSVPGCIIVKCTSTTGNWVVYHRSAPSSLNGYLNTTDDFGFGPMITSPTSTQFSINTAAAVNTNGETYVAYLFAHDAGGFGLTGSDNVISCGSYTGNGSATGPTITLGYEPQWLMIKNASGVGNWNMIDNMRGMPVGSADAFLEANTLDVEATADWVSPTATGFNIVSTSSEVNTNTSTYIYIAIRRGPMKVPTSGTSVFAPSAVSSDTTPITTNFPVDSFWEASRAANSLNTQVAARFTGENTLRTSGTAVEAGYLPLTWMQSNTSYTPNLFGSTSVICYAFGRAPGFFDVVCYTGTGVARTVNHNLGVAPQLIIVKARDAAWPWPCYVASLGNNKMVYLNTTASAYTVNATYWNSTNPTASVFSLGTDTELNAAAGTTYIAYLFATCAGVSKVGSYTGTGALQTINCGFSAGARFVLIRRTDSTGDWYVYDSARGISSGNDPYLLLNTTAAEVTGTNYVDTTSVGFQVTAAAPAGLNANGGTYIFLAIA